MAARRNETTPEQAADGAAHPPAADLDSAAMMALIRMVSRLAIGQSHARGAASFRAIAVQELGIARHQDIDAIEAWLAAHPGD
jgi:hypothetical protein